MTLSASYVGVEGYQNSIEVDRQVLSYLSGGISGVIRDSEIGSSVGALLARPAPGQHAVEIQTGAAFAEGRNIPGIQGAYWFRSDAIETIPLPPTQSAPFIATVIGRVVDSQYGTPNGEIGPRFDVISGTPSTDPTPVSDVTINGLNIPGGWFRITDTRINTGDTGAIPISQVVDKRTTLPARAGDPIECTSTTRPPGVIGRQIYERDTNAVGFYDGVDWRMTDHRWQSYTVVWTSNGATKPTVGNGTLLGRYSRRGKLVTAQIQMVIGFGSSGGSGETWTWSVPFRPFSGQSSAVLGHLELKNSYFSPIAGILSGTAIGGVADGNRVILRPGYTLPTGSAVMLEVTYEMAS